MKTYPIPEGIAPQYHGSGYALVAHHGGILARIIYLRDVLRGFDDQQLSNSIRRLVDAAYITKWVGAEAIAPAIAELQSFGDVSIGMCSCWEFVEL